MNPLYQTNTRITYYDLDCNGKIKLSALLRIVHVAADVNAKELGAGYDNLAPLGMTFILQRFGVNIIRMPAYDEDVTIRTWPSDVSKGTFLRRGDMYDHSGTKVMEWASLWLLFDINARKVLRPSALPVPLPTLGDEGINILPEKLTHPGDWGKEYFRYTHQATYRDVDTNMHMNNSIYGDLIGNAMFPVVDKGFRKDPHNLQGSQATEDSQQGETPHAASNIPLFKQVQINYLAEIRIGATVEVVTRHDGDDGDRFYVIGESEGRTAFIARIN